MPGHFYSCKQHNHIAMITRSSSELAGVCQQCRQTARAFSTSRIRRKIGPEHPNYIEIPEPPQQTGKSRQVLKGTLPVPRSLFSGKRGQDEHRRESVRLSTLDEQHGARYDPPAADTYLSWQNKISAQRKQNLRDGVAELKRRHEKFNKRRDHVSKVRAQEREEATSRPEREDERLTAHSNNFDYNALMHGQVHDKDRAKNIEEAKERFIMREARKQQERFEHLHTLFTKASKFITTPEQLDEAIETSFGTDEDPVVFSRDYLNSQDTHSIWALGKPPTLQDLLRTTAIGTAEGVMTPQQITLRDARLKKVAEALTGGAMGD